MNKVLSIPNQRFCFMESGDADLEEDVVRCTFGKMQKGTIYICNDVFEDDEDAIIPFGIPDGESEGRIAFWEGLHEIDPLWDKLIEAKHKMTQCEEDKQ